MKLIMKLTHKELIASKDLKNRETGARMQQGNAEAFLCLQ